MQTTGNIKECAGQIRLCQEKSGNPPYHWNQIVWND